MPCLILCGHPCAGKTRLAELIRDRVLAAATPTTAYSSSPPPTNNEDKKTNKTTKKRTIQKVVIINEATACPDQTINECYATSRAEKFTRGALKAAFDRCVMNSAKNNENDDNDGDASSTLVVLDSLNYIKGFRYELFCISKAAGQKHGVVWVLNESKLCKEWNQKRREESSSSSSSYDDDLIDELILRFEPPDARKRWDNPLYRIDVRPPGVKQQSGLAKETLEQSVYNMHKLSDAINEETASTASTTTGITSSSGNKKPSSTFKRAGFKKKAIPPKDKDGISVSDDVDDSAKATEESKTDANSPDAAEKKEFTIEEQVDQMLDSFLSNVEALKEGMSTRQNVSSNADVLHDVDSITQQVCSLITVAQNKSTTAGGRLSITLSGHPSEPIWFDFNNRRIPLPELRRLRRQYIQWVVAHPPEDATERGIAVAFITYIAAQQ